MQTVYQYCCSSTKSKNRRFCAIIAGFKWEYFLPKPAKLPTLALYACQHGIQLPFSQFQQAVIRYHLTRAASGMTKNSLLYILSLLGCKKRPCFLKILSEKCVVAAFSSGLFYLLRLRLRNPVVPHRGFRYQQRINIYSLSSFCTLPAVR